MTPEGIAKLRVGDIVEFDNGLCYWLGKLVSKDKDGDWLVRNHGKTAAGVAGTSILKYPENVQLVGYSPR